MFCRLGTAKKTKWINYNRYEMYIFEFCMFVYVELLCNKEMNIYTN